MADSKRQTILAAVKTILEGITSGGVRTIPHVEISKIPPVDLETVALPCCFIYSDRETKYLEGDNAVIGSETWEWYIMLEVWALDKEMETLLSSIHSAMYANYEFTNTAEWSERMGVDFYTVDVEQRLEAMIIPYRVIYRHQLGSMIS